MVANSAHSLKRESSRGTELNQPQLVEEPDDYPMTDDYRMLSDIFDF